MTRLTSRIILFLLLILCATTAGSQSANSVQELQKIVSKAYTAKNLAALDKKLVSGSVLVEIVHSLMEGKGSVVRRRFKTFAQLDAWLKKRETEEGAPFRQVSELVKCAKGHCAYNYDNGILHNQLYLHDIYYRFRNGRPYIIRIDLLDGD
jgi:hypothetical protein